MAIANPFFLFPFGTDGDPSDITPIDNEGGMTGPLSYQYGFTPNYEEDLISIPSALPIPRPEFNQLMFDITSALRQLQLQGAPLWVTPAAPPAQGGPVSYPLWARVSYTAAAPNGLQIWESQVSGNTSVPGDDSNWLVVSGGRGIAPGTYIDSASPRGYQGALLCDGASYARLDYPLLFQALTYTATCTTTSSVTVNVPPDVINLASAGWRVEGSGVTPGTFITAVGATTLTLSAATASSGSFVLTFLPYGYGASGTNVLNFGVPDCRRRVSVAAGGSGNTILGNKLADQGGSDTYFMELTDIANHTHSYGQNPPAFTANFGFDAGFAVQGATSLATTSQIDGRPSGQTGQTNMNIIQQSNIVFRYVKF